MTFFHIISNILTYFGTFFLRDPSSFIYHLIEQTKCYKLAYFSFNFRLVPVFKNIKNHRGSSKYLLFCLMLRSFYITKFNFNRDKRYIRTQRKKLNWFIPFFNVSENFIFSLKSSRGPPQGWVKNENSLKTHFICEINNFITC